LAPEPFSEDLNGFPQAAQEGGVVVGLGGELHFFADDFFLLRQLNGPEVDSMGLTVELFPPLSEDLGEHPGRHAHQIADPADGQLLKELGGLKIFQHGKIIELERGEKIRFISGKHVAEALRPHHVGRDARDEFIGGDADRRP
jgi:hypothetical protein